MYYFPSSFLRQFAALFIGIGVFLTAAKEFALAQPAALPTSRIEQSRRFDVDPTFGRAEGGSQLFQPDAPSTAPATEGDDDIGVQAILHRKDKFKSFTVFGNASGYYTDNVFLTKDQQFYDRYMAGEVGASYTPKFTDRFFGEVTLKQQFFRYDNYSVLDFDGQVGTVGLTYIVPELEDTAVFLRYTYTRLTRSNNDSVASNGDLEEDGTEFYKNHGVTFGAQKSWELSKAHYVFLGSTVDLGYTDWDDPAVASPQRNDYALFTGYRANITRNFEAQLFYRLAMEDYTKVPQEDRVDLKNLVSVSFVYNWTDWLNLTVNSSFVFNDSNWNANSYEAATYGSTLGLNYRF